ncbi:hypothetical protein [Anabaena sp. CCY 0017]|uniref:hypothetical protein n=1 Tax=Anabaena sp. CCY 0017 TaxID=3103866 RepID=UPI0039C73439
MPRTLPLIYFYIPKKDHPSIGWPESINDYWSWMKICKVRYPGAESWTLQTYLHLKAANFPCELIDTLPDEGIVLAHSFSLPFNLKPSSKVLLICLRDDKKNHPYCQLHVVQNRHQALSKGLSSLWKSHYIPLWTQTKLTPRDETRGDRFENIAYLGDISNLAPELREPSWKEQLEALGLRWITVGDTASWHDYSEMDAVLAIRSFSKCRYNNKPASKLYNAWRANVPAILGCESAYQAERKSEFDYLEADSVNVALSGLIKLRDNPEFRMAMVANGQIRAQEVQTEAILESWHTFLMNKAVPMYYQWCETSPWLQQSFLRFRHYVYLKIDGLNRREIFKIEL